jgi:hypothetical protein
VSPEKFLKTNLPMTWVLRCSSINNSQFSTVLKLDMFLLWTVDTTKCVVYHNAAPFAACGHSVIHLPPYVRYLNPMELAWHQIKIYIISHTAIADMSPTGLQKGPRS